MTVPKQGNGLKAARPADPGSLEGQLHSVYAERERLAAELGTADTDELVAMVKQLRKDAGGLDESLVAQVESLYGERDQMQQKIGVSAAHDVIELVKSLKKPASAATRKKV